MGLGCSTCQTYNSLPLAEQYFLTNDEINLTDDIKWVFNYPVSFSSVYNTINFLQNYCFQNINKTPNKQASKQALWPSVRKRTIPTGRPPLVNEI
jgi:hypothetical protein